jgi:hypothetical protein
VEPLAFGFTADLAEAGVLRGISTCHCEERSLRRSNLLIT